MNRPTTTLEWRAAFAAAFLIAIGAFLGVAADRLWMAHSSRAAEQTQVSVEALAYALNLNARQTEEIAALVDSIGWTISEAIEQHPDSLNAIVRQARQRLERAVPMDRQHRLQTWMDSRRAAMLDRMRSGGRMRGGPGRGRHLSPDSGPRRGTGQRRQRSGGEM